MWIMVRGEIWPKCWHLHFLVSIKAHTISSGQYHYETPPIIIVLFQHGLQSQCPFVLIWNNLLHNFKDHTMVRSRVCYFSISRDSPTFRPKSVQCFLQYVLSFGLLPWSTVKSVLFCELPTHRWDFQHFDLGSQQGEEEGCWIILQKILC